MKLKYWGLTFALCALCSGVFAEETAKPENDTAVKPYNFTYEMGKHMPSDTFIGEINSSQMEEALYKDFADDRLYVKFDTDKVLVFSDLSEDRGSCRQILYAAPNEQMLEVYTKNKKAFSRMYKTVHSYIGEWNLVAGYQVVCDKSPAVKLDKKINLYRMWFKKVKPDNRATRVVGVYTDPYPYYFPPVIIGGFWGHHHGYGGPRHPGHRPGPGPRPGPRR